MEIYLEDIEDIVVLLPLEYKCFSRYRSCWSAGDNIYCNVGVNSSPSGLASHQDCAPWSTGIPLVEFKSFNIDMVIISVEI